MWNNPRVLNAVSLVLIVLACAALVFTGLTQLARSSRFAIKRITVVSPLVNVDPRLVERIIRKEFAGTYFTLDLRRAQSAIARVPWVKSVAIRRVWPRSIEIRIVEHVAFARWNADMLLSEEAQVFAGETTAALPQLNGPEGSHADVLRKFKQAQAALAPLKYSVRVMTLSPSHSLSAELNEGPSVHFGRDQFEVRLARLVEFGGQIRNKVGVPIESFDLRYSRGIAVAMESPDPARLSVSASIPDEKKQP